MPISTGVWPRKWARCVLPLEVDAVKDRLTVASLDHPHCLSSRNLEDFLASEEAGNLELEINPVNTLEEAIQGLKEGELDP